MKPMSWIPKGKEQKGAGKCFVQTFNYFTSLVVWVAQRSVFIWSHQTFSAPLSFTLASTPLMLHRAFLPMTLTDVSSAPHASQIEAEIKKKYPSAHFFAWRPSSCTRAALSFYTNITSCLLKSACTVESTFTGPPTYRASAEKNHQRFAYTFPMNNSALCNAHKQVRFLFWGISSQPRFPAEQPVVLLGLAASQSVQHLENSKGAREGLSSPSLWLCGGARRQDMACPRVSVRLKLFWKPLSFDTVWGTAFRG